MPIFEYECCDCGSKFEKFVSSGADTATCKQCSSPRVAQMLSVFAVTGNGARTAMAEPGPCACGAPRRGMCGE
ncbi:MAG: FmdB family zinc ribbon protein [Terriglobia bacterium]